MKVLVGSVAKTEEIKNAILEIEEIHYEYQGKNGLNMVFHCDEPNKKIAERKIKDKLKSMPELGGIFYNVTGVED